MKIVSKNNQISNKFSLSVILFVSFFIIGLVSFFVQIKYPPCCDADQYIEMALHYFKAKEISFFSWNDTVRPYGYPFLINLFMKLNLLNLPTIFWIFLCQISLYFLAVFKIASFFRTNYPKAHSEIILFGLLANIFIYPLLAITLTDGISISLILFLVYFVLLSYQQLIDEIQSNNLFAYFFVIGSLLALLIEIRPANIYLFLPISFFLFSFLKQTSFVKFISLFAIFLFGFLLFISPQIFLNLNSFEKLTWLPIHKQNEFFDAGAKLLKCNTNLTGSGGGLMCSVNPFYDGVSQNYLQFFINDFVGFFKTIFLHIYGGFYVNYYFPYVYKLNIAYSPLLFFISNFFLFFGLVGLVNFFMLVRGTKSLGNFLLFFILLIILGWASIHALIPLDIRYSLMIFQILSVSSILYFFKNYHVKINYLYFFIFLLIAFYLDGIYDSNVQMLNSLKNIG